MITLYHGTDLESAKSIYKNGINVKIGSTIADFGQGFYTTPDLEKAEKWAKRKSDYRGKRPAIVILEFDELEAESVIKTFSDDLPWAKFVVNNRNGLAYIKKVSYKENNLDARYEITRGRIADVDVIEISKLLKRNGMELDSIEQIYNPDYPLQIVFHTEQELKFIKKVQYHSI